ncbi:TolC family protein [Clostridium butyricum]|uniref:TolC family protein n=1 Tax=Clostridium butyricum TaxID=1492 RepID=UPI00374FD4A7
MRKNLNKIVAFAIGVSVISGSIVPAMAADIINTDTIVNTQTQASTEKKVLTVDDAVKAAIANSNSLALLDKSIKLQESTNNLSEKIDDVSKKSDLDEDYNEDTRKLTLDQLKQSRDFAEDKLVQETTDAFNNIVVSKINMDKQKSDIAIKERSLEQSKLQQKLGLVTSVQIEDLELSLQGLKNDLKKNEDTFKDVKNSFKADTGLDIDNYVLDDTIKYTKFELDGNLDEYLDGVIDEYLSYDEQIYELNKDYWNDDDNKVTTPNKPTEMTEAPKLNLDGITDTTQIASEIETYVQSTISFQNDITRYISQVSARITYLQKKFSVDKSETELIEKKKAFKEVLRSVYTSLKAQEDSIDLIQKSIDLENKKIRIEKINYDLGLMTKLDYDTKVNDCQTLNTKLRILINNYNTFKLQLEKPWTNPKIV